MDEFHEVNDSKYNKEGGGRGGGGGGGRWWWRGSVVVVEVFPPLLPKGLLV